MSKRYILIDEETGEQTGITLEPDEIAVLDRHAEHMSELEKTIGSSPVGWTRLHVLAVSVVMHGIEALQEKCETPAAGTAGESR